jgi:long-chain acyl-CoA synthetase
VEVRIVDPDATGHGEIAVRGPNVMLGYYQKPEETAAVLRDGWFFTGDLGYRDRDGYFFITGRSKEMIVLATGKKIFPDELEKFYKQIPSIKEICILAGERGLEAAVVPDFEYLRRMNLSSSRETIAFAIEDLAKDLPPYKRIAGLKVFKDPLPITRLGKLRRAKVRELYDRIAGAVDARPLVDADAALLADPVMQKLLACLAPFSAKKQIVPDDNLELDLGLDSLARVELVVSIEKTFGLALPDSFGSEVFTVRDAVAKIRQALSSGAVAAGSSVKMSWAEILAQPPDADLLATLRFEKGFFCTAGQYLLRTGLKLFLLLYGRLSVRGLGHLPPAGPFILAPNHLSFADAPSVMAAVPWSLAARTFFLGATDYFGGPVTSRIAPAVHVIPVDMDTRLYGAMQLSAQVLRQGRVLCVFPEGSRSRDGSIKEFKKGVAILARELNIPVVPVAIDGTYAMLPPGRSVPRPAKITVSFGRPITPAGRGYDEIVNQLQAEVAALLKADVPGRER